MRRKLAIGLDVGATKVEGVLVDVEADGQIRARRRVLTPSSDAEATVETIVAVAGDLRDEGGADVAAVGIGAAGLVDRQGVMRFAPNIAWRDQPVAARVGAAVGLPTILDNDANAAAWGEFRFGSGRGSTDMVLVTVGTGIGGGVVIDGSLFRGAHGFAAELGHFIVDPGGPVCGCGARGCWEVMASGRAIGRLGRLAAGEHPDSVLAHLAGGDPENATGEVVTRAAREGDPIALGVLAEVGRRLGEGIAGLVNFFDPEVVVVGGGAIEAGDMLLEPARRAFAGTVMGPEYRPDVPIVAAVMGNEAGAVGAADLAWRQSTGP